MGNPRWSRRLVGLVIAVVVGTSACGADGGGGAGSGDGPIRIGVIGPLSGALAYGGEDHLRGYQLAVDEVNAEGGIGGRQVELVPGDAATAEQGLTETRRLATQENVDAFVGTYSSGASNTASETAARYQKLYWETNALANDLTDRGLPNFVRVGTNANAYGEQSAAFVEVLTGSLGKPIQELRVFIEHEDSIYGTSIANRQEELLTAAGAQVVGRSSHATTATDVTDVVLRAREANPDVWMFAGYPTDTHLVLNTANGQGFRPPAILLTGVGDTVETREAVAPDYLNGVMVVGYPRPDVSAEFAPGGDEYAQRYRETFGEEPRTPPGFAAYAGMQVLLDVIAEAGSTDPAAVRDVVAGMDLPVGSMANGWGVQFDQSFQNQRTVPTVIQWQDGEAVTVFPAEAAAGGEMVGLPLS